jgi:hypothetical protein
MDGYGAGLAVAHDPRTGHFVAGHTEYRAKQKRIAERLVQLMADYDASPTQQQLLAIAAKHLDEAATTRRAERRVSATNAAQRILRSIPRREAPLRTVRQLLDEAHDGR